MTSGSHDAQGLLWGHEPAGWASHEPNHAPLYQAMIDATDIEAGTTVLDVGCGAGTFCELLNSLGASVVGVDASPGMIEYATNTFDGIDFRVGRIEELSFSRDTFDAVFAANSVQYATDLVIGLEELRRVCKPNGVIVAALFGSPDGISYKPVFDALSEFMPKPPDGAKAAGPFRLSSPGLLEEGFTAAGITVTARGEVNCPFEYRNWDHFWSATRSAGPTQRAIGVAGHDAVEEATRNAIASFIAADGTITFATNVFVYVVGQA